MFFFNLSIISSSFQNPFEFRFCDYIIWELSVIKYLRQILLLNCLSIPVYLY